METQDRKHFLSLAMTRVEMQMVSAHMFYCKCPDYLKRNCRQFAADNSPKHGKSGKKVGGKVAKQHAKTPTQSASSSDAEHGFVACHVLSTTPKGAWIVDSGATCHMCNDQTLFKNLTSLKQPQEVTLGNGYVLEAIGQGTVSLQMILQAQRNAISTPHCMFQSSHTTY